MIARRIENAEGCLLRSSSGNNSGNGFKRPCKRRAFKAELLPMRMAAKQAIQHLVQHFSARIQRPEFDILSGRYDFDRRAYRSHVPARIPLWIFVAGRKIDAAIAVQLMQ